MKVGLPFLAGALAAFLTSSAAPAQTAVPNPTSDEIVVTAQRSGIPVWRVRNGRSTVVIVGTIDGVAEGTDWRPEQLAAALRGADQVMFPQATQYQGGIFQILGVRAKAKKLAYLPPGQGLQTYLSPAQLSRIASLQSRGMLQKDFANRRPIFVAYDLIEAAKRERTSSGFLSISRVDWKADPDAFVRHTAKKYRLRMLPMRTERLTVAFDKIGQLPANRQLPCLMAAADFAEAPAGTYQARSQAWAKRRVPVVLASPADIAFSTCAPLVRQGPDARSSLVQALNQPLTTIAVLGLSTLGGQGGVLDYLNAQGFEVGGPRWKA
jgi:uncharacterized protein YbaP (TraB family)